MNIATGVWGLPLAIAGTTGSQGTAALVATPNRVLWSFWVQSGAQLNSREIYPVL
jgi:hypothetical protein